MFDYSKQIEAFRDKKVRLTDSMKKMLRKHRKTNRNKLKSNLPKHLPKVSITDASFSPQGSFQMETIIQTKFEEQEYDVDDGILIKRNQLTDDNGNDLSSSTILEAIRASLEDQRFKKQPIICSNCVRVFYADTDEKKHHIDFPAYRTWSEGDDNNREIANEDDWLESDPGQVASWFADCVTDRQTQESGFGTQLRRLIQLTKRFCKSREDWLEALPNGMKLTMLVEECHDEYIERIDIAFRTLFENLESRLENSLEIENRAHPDKPKLTRTKADKNVIELKKRIREALDKLDALDLPENDNQKSAREAWDWIFQTDEFFDAVDGVETTQKSFSSSLATIPSVPWQEIPLWKKSVTENISIIARWKPSGGAWTFLPSNAPPIPKHVDLRFDAKTTATTPYTVFWQVTNSGRQAFDAASLRGEIMESKSAGAGGLHSTTVEGMSHGESTLYSGRHWVICYLVKDDRCIAESAPFIVNIQ
jgi:hypothetical protein